MTKKRISTTLLGPVSSPPPLPPANNQLLDDLKGVVKDLGNSVARQSGLVGADPEAIRERVNNDAVRTKFGAKSKGTKRMEHETDMAIHKAIKSKGKKYSEKQSSLTESAFFQKRKMLEDRAAAARMQRERADEARRMIARKMLEEKLSREGHVTMAGLYREQHPQPSWAPSLPTVEQMRMDRDLLDRERKIKGNTGETALALLSAQDKVNSLTPQSRSSALRKNKCSIAPYSKLRKADLIDKLIDYLPLSDMVGKARMDNMTVKELRKMASQFCRTGRANGVGIVDSF